MSTLQPELWRRAARVFEIALDQEALVRPAFLDRACGPDAALREAVEALLAAHVQDSALDEAWERPALELPEPEEAGPWPAAVGPYRLLQRIGRGGLCDVYLAERDGDGYRQAVAVKVLRPGLREPALLRRLRLERQILAGLDHPHIARLLDGGTTEAGDPYVVMEYVAGMSITRYCDLRKLPVRGRVELFRAVCAAVQHAHQSLVVHRDIKPSNILVTDEGRPKLLDFGIAKGLAGGGGAAGETRTQERLLTPDYASPEQVAGGPITTASDVYSLGVLLHELLTGRPPLRWAHESPEELLARLQRAERRPPSAVVVQREDGPAAMDPGEAAASRSATPAQLRRELAGDLDTIVLRALEPDPGRRYASVEQLSEDLGRYLTGRPIQARPPRLGYRLGKFVRRYPGGVAAAAIAALAGVAFVASTLVHSRQVARERDLARSEQRRAEEVTRFLVSAFQVSDPAEARGATVTARELLDRGSARVERELAGEPLLQAALMDTMGRVYANLGLYASARPLLEGALQRRLAAHGPRHLDVAASQIRLALLLVRKGEPAESERLVRGALETRRSLLGEDHVDVAESLAYVGYALRDRRGSYSEAEPLIRRALAIQRRRLGDSHPDTALTLAQLGALLEAKGDLRGAESLHREALAALRHAFGSDHPSVAGILKRLGALVRDRGDAVEAEALLREALAIAGRVIGVDSHDYASILNELGLAVREAGRYDEAESLLRQGLAIARRRDGAGAVLAAHLSNLGIVLAEKGDPRAAEPLFREALRMTRAQLGAEAPQNCAKLNSLGAVLFDQGRYAAAEAAFRESLALSRKLEAEHWTVGWTLSYLADVRRARGKPAEGLALADAAVAILSRTLPAGHVRRHIASGVRGHCLVGLRRFEEAEPVLLSSYQALAAARGPRHFVTRRAARRLSALYQAWGRGDRLRYERLAVLPSP